MEARLLAFLGIAVILTVTPGPDFALVTRVALGRGRVAAWLTSLGIVSGHLLWGIASSIGVTALLKASPTLYTVLRLLGAAYLIWLGIQSFLSRSAGQEKKMGPLLTHNFAAYRQGLINDLLNPKIGVFYMTMLPQFIGPGQSIFLFSLMLAAIFALIVAIWLAICVVLLARIGEVIRRPAVRRMIERLCGVVLIGLGIHLALERS
ncbi:LysE family translocator [Ktedonosporobacter rubrisoli]|uniref:LysE family translocator n=1 Tax=Ktedonosporobacter rubrisoli TaxID=2509675 RepID=A0A4P6K117_KTERU|nr:LysE family translocator [Ktedonosporobacter rubrisoli]QBD81116.1 LysE family translocator [Ktedonosporobacter rubrisoli]